jgi:hypothetical protein
MTEMAISTQLSTPPFLGLIKRCEAAAVPERHVKKGKQEAFFYQTIGSKQITSS